MNTTTARSNPATPRRRRLRFSDSRRFGPEVDARKLYWTLVFLIAASLPFVMHLPIWPVALVIGSAAWRWRLRQRGGTVPHALLRYTLTFIMAGIVYVTFGTFNGIEPGTSLLLMMAAMKLLESVAVRDLLVLIYMSFFMLLALFLFDQSIATTVLALTLVWCGVMTLTQVNRETSPEPLSQAARKSGRLLLQAAPLLLLLFLLFPRIPGPFWALPTTDNGQTGLSDSMSPGSISNLLESSEIAFRAYFKDAQPARQELYWRGPVLEVLEGRQWHQRRVQTQTSDVELSGPGIEYTLMLEPHQSHWLLALEFAQAESLPRHTLIRTTGELVSRKVVSERLRLELTSYPQYRFAVELDDAQRAINLDTSRTDNPRTQRLALTWKEQLDSPAAIVTQALNYFNQQPFVYSLSGAKIDGTQAMDQFLFDRRRGFCEHYASSFALLMRYAGIPARVVTGYMGGEINALTGHTTVRQSDAHAWAEVWLKDRGWVRIDPTAAVAPERVEQGVADALPDGEFLPTLMMSRSGLMTGLRQTIDAINAHWNNWVLGYSDERQWSLLKKLGLQERNLSTLLLLLTGSMTALLAALALWIRYRSTYRPDDPALRLYHQLQRRLHRLGIDRSDTEDASSLARRVAATAPELADAVARFCALYEQMRYGRTPPTQGQDELKRLLRQIPRLGRRISRQTT